VNVPKERTGMSLEAGFTAVELTPLGRTLGGFE